MAWTDEETRRVQNIENAIAKLNQALQNVASKRQLNHVLTLVQREIDSLQSEIDDLKSQLAALQK